jgi:dTMP kinase
MSAQMSSRAKLITIEGIDGAGKTTLARRLEHALTERGHQVVLLREPGGVEVSERLRRLVKDPELKVGNRTEALLYAAARAQLVEEAVAPLLTAGTWVLLDRFVDSSLAYQGAGRGLGIERIAALNEFATGGLTPDRTLLLVLDGPGARERIQARESSGDQDRLEREHDSFFERVSGAYAELAAREPQRIRAIDATLSADEVLRASLDALADLL